MITSKEWNGLRFKLFEGLTSLRVHEIYLIEQDSNTLTLCFVLEDCAHIRPLTRMRMLDELISKNCPDLYAHYVFLYEVWSKEDWGMQLVNKLLTRASRS